MAKMVLFKIWKFPQLTETFIINQVVIAIKLGYDVKILVGECLDFKDNSDLRLINEYKIREKIILENYKIPENRFLRYLKAFCLLFTLAPFWFSLVRFYKLSTKKRISLIYIFHFYNKFRTADALHVQFGTNKNPVDLLKESGLLTGKLIVSFHGHDLHFPIYNHIPNNGYYNLLFKSADHLICNTTFLKQKLLEINAPSDKIEVVPASVNTKIFIPGKKFPRNNIIKLVTVGRVDELKGQQYGIHAVRILKDRGYIVEYYIVGEGSYSNEIIELVSNMELTENVRLMGKMFQPEVLQLLQSADIFLMTSVTETNGMQESQGLVTAEAQACGLPVIAFDSGGVKYTLQEGVTGFLCEEKDIECIASKVECLINNEELRKNLSENAIKFIERNYSEKSVLKKWKKLYG